MESRVGRQVKVLVGEYKGVTGAVVMDRDNVVYVRVDPPRRTVPATIIVSVTDLKFVDLSVVSGPLSVEGTG